MRFALLGEHPDALAFASACSSGRHQLVAVSGRFSPDTLERLGHPHAVSDIEEILADPTVEAVIVAGSPADRGEQLRRALQSERHVLCVHPASGKPDLAYEAQLLQQDAGVVLFPLLPEALHPALSRLAEFIDRTPDEPRSSSIGSFRLLLFERHSTGEVLDAGPDGLDPALPGWDILRRLGGEIIEVSSFAEGEELEVSKPVLLTGRFEKGGLFQVSLIPRQTAGRWRLVVIGTHGQAELTLAEGWTGAATLTWQASDRQQEESWQGWDPWDRLLNAFEAALDRQAGLGWQDEVRALELDDAARRSVVRRRVNQMEYPEASEEVGFKGTMTLLGCAMIWVVIALLIASRWQPLVGWLILPMLVLFIGLQLLRYLIPRKPE